MARTFRLNEPFGDMTVLENVVVGKLRGSEPAGGLKKAWAESEDILAFTGLLQRKSKRPWSSSGAFAIPERR